MHGKTKETHGTGKISPCAGVDPYGPGIRCSTRPSREGRLPPAAGAAVAEAISIGRLLQREVLHP